MAAASARPCPQALLVRRLGPEVLDLELPKKLTEGVQTTRRVYHYFTNISRDYIHTREIDAVHRTMQVHLNKTWQAYEALSEDMKKEDGTFGTYFDFRMKCSEALFCDPIFLKGWDEVRAVSRAQKEDGTFDYEQIRKRFAELGHELPEEAPYDATETVYHVVASSVFKACRFEPEPVEVEEVAKALENGSLDPLAIAPFLKIAQKAHTFFFHVAKLKECEQQLKGYGAYDIARETCPTGCDVCRLFGK